MSANNEDRECPLCLEALELDDLNFFPCTCGYQICRFCWHRIRTNENGLCPACRKQYSEDPANFKPLTFEELQQIKNEKKQKDMQRKQKISENRKHLANVRVVQKNLVFVVGLPPRLADADELKKSSYFGKFGKIVKVIVNCSTSYAGSQAPSASAYVTYYKVEDALRAIQSVNNTKLDGRMLKASLGTTKYCSNFLKKLQCPKQDCMYLHELGDEAASFTKEDMQAGLHQEYENKLHEQMLANEAAHSRKQSSPVDHGSNSIQVFPKEKCPSKKDHTSSHYTGSPQFDKSPSSSTAENSPEPIERKDDTPSNSGRCSADPVSQVLERHSGPPNQKAIENGNSFAQGQNNVQNSEIASPGMWHNPVRDMPVPFRSSEPYLPNTEMPAQRQLSPYENHFISTHSETVLPQLQNGVTTRCQPVSYEHYESKSTHSSLTNGLGHDTSHKTMLHPSYNWPNGQSKDCLKSLLNDTSTDLPSFFNSVPTKANSMTFSGTRNNIPLSLYSGVQSIHEGLSHVQNSVSLLTQNNAKGLYSPSSSSSESVLNNHDDDLGFDPWQESSKGLAEMMLKEADEKSKTNGVLLNRPNMANCANRRTVPFSDSISRNSALLELSRYTTQRPPTTTTTVPPPGFSLHSCGANTVPRPLFGETFHNKSLPVMNTYNQSPSAQVTHFQQNIPTQNGFSFNHNMFNSRDTEVRPQACEWQESFPNMQQRNLDLAYNPVSHQLPNHVGGGGGRISSSSSWNNTSLSEMLWQQHDQSVNQGRNICSLQVDKMLQQLKLNDQNSGRMQNHIKYTPFTPFKGGNS